MKCLLFILVLASCSSVQKFVVENETVTDWYYKPMAHAGDFAVIRDTILRVHDLKGKRRLFWDYPVYDDNIMPVRLKYGDTIAFDVKRNIVKALQLPTYFDKCGKKVEAWMELSWDNAPPLPLCKFK